MAAATFKVELKSDLNADGTRSVRIRITRNRQHAYYNTGIRIRTDGGEKKSEWNEDPDELKGNWIRKHINHKRYNQEIKHALEKLDVLGKQYPTYTARQLKEEYENPKPVTPESEKSLVAFMEELQARFSANGRESYAQQLKYTLRVLKEYAGTKTKDSQILTPSFMSGFHSYLKNKKQKSSDERRYKPKTIKVYFSALSNAYQMGVAEGRVQQAGNPFAGLDLFVPPTKQRRPTPDVFGFLYSLDLSDNEKLFHARNAFLLFFLLNGGRVSEIVQLQWEHIDEQYVSYLPAKKSAKWKKIPRNEMINHILSYYKREGKYVLPYLEDNAAKLPAEEFYYAKKQAKDSINTSLKSLSKKLNIPTLTCHMARRTWTDSALKVLDTRAVQHLGGWSTLAMVEKYADEKSQEETDIASGLIFSHINFSGKQ